MPKEEKNENPYKIHNFIVHEVFWNGDEKSKIPDKLLRDKENNPSKLSAAVVLKLAKLFEETSLASGLFTSEKRPESGEPAVAPTLFHVKLMESYNEQEMKGFVDFTQKCTENFTYYHWGKAKTAKPGYLLFYHYTVNNSHFLAVVMLHKTQGIKLDEQLALEEVDQLDLSTLHLAARINLSIWSNPEKLNSRYIKFRLGKSTSDLRQFFTDFIGCNEYTEQKEDTAKLINAIEKHCQTKSYDSERMNQVLEEAADYCRAKENLNDEGQIKLSSLSNKIFPEAPEEFLILAQNEPFSLNEQFGIHNRTLSKFKRFSGSSKNLNISFLRKALDNDILFDREKRMLVITKIPPELLSELNTLNPTK
tara:strand:+ start:10209 stop:11300 length:1092 start_codon:yes stop_codon:yes gene_type:complete